MRKIASMVLVGAGLLLLCNQASAAETKRPVASKRAAPAVQIVKMDPIAARPQKPVAAVEVTRRRLRSSQELAGPRLVARIGQGLHRRPF